MTDERILWLQSALAELTANRQHFTEQSYNEIADTLMDRIALLRATSELDGALPTDADKDEIRLVTVMFLDIQDSTRMAQILGDDWKPLITDIHRQIAQVVEEWAGEIGQYLGDGVLCFFGAHRSRDDDAIRAVSCALALQQMADEIALSMSSRDISNFGIRIGISTGRVVVGMIGTGGKRETVALGWTTNLASRLQNMCPAGQVLIDVQTYQGIRDYFKVIAQPPVTLKGFDAPVATYLVLERRETKAMLPLNDIAGISLAFVGRETELNYILRRWDEAIHSGQLQVVLIYGETGVGKSRLLHEVLDRVSDGNVYTLMMSAHYENRDVSHSLLRGLIHELCNISDSVSDATAESRIMKYFTQTWTHSDASQAAVVVGRLVGFAFSDYPASTWHPLQTVAHWFDALAGKNALLISVDDLQWADEESLQLLEYLPVALVSRAGAIMATARTEFRRKHHDFMYACPMYTDITLGRLSDDATRRLIESVLDHVDNVPSVLYEHITSRAEGNPLFIEEFLRMLFDSGVFEPIGNGRWKTNIFQYGMLPSALPNGLTGVFQARLDDLPVHARRVVQMAAVVGETFWEEAVVKLSGFDVTSVLTDLETRGIITHNAESRLDHTYEYAFRHTLYREVAYAMLTRLDRELYHQRAAEWLTKFVYDYPELMGQLADHLVAGQKREQALAVYLVAAEDQMRKGDATETLKLVERGLASARDVPREVALPFVCQLWMWQGQALITLQRYEEASAAGQTALMLMSELPPMQLVEERALAARTLQIAEQHSNIRAT